MVASFVRYGGSRQEILEQAKKLLRDNGYVVIPKERRLILTVNHMMPPHHDRHRMGKERLADMLQSQQERQFGRALFDSGLVVNHVRPLSDPVTGNEEVFTSTIACIVPKADEAQ